jgi:hypothetical protein
LQLQGVGRKHFHASTKQTKTMTKINYTYPWGIIRRNGNRLLCADGVIRAAELAQTPDTFFSIPAHIRIKGKRIEGYASSDESKGERVWTFRPMNSEKEAFPFLTWPDRSTKENQKALDAILERGVN